MKDYSPKFKSGLCRLIYRSNFPAFLQFLKVSPVRLSLKSCHITLVLIQCNHMNGQAKAFEILQRFMGHPVSSWKKSWARQIAVLELSKVTCEIRASFQSGLERCYWKRNLSPYLIFLPQKYLDSSLQKITKAITA